MKNLLLAQFGWTEEEDRAVYASVEAQVAAAVEFGMNSPAMQVEDMLKNLFAEEVAQ